MADEVVDEFVGEITALFESLDSASYYEFLGITPSCDYVAVRDAFYARAQRFHPDRFVHVDEASTRDAVYAVYKRITEAYNVLSDPELRSTYDAARLRGEMRLAAVARSRRLDSEQRQISSGFARIYLRSARAKLERGDVVGAWIDAELGLSVEDAAPLRDLHQEILAKLTSPEHGAGR